MRAAKLLIAQDTGELCACPQAMDAVDFLESFCRSLPLHIRPA